MTTQVQHWKYGNGNIVAKVGSTSIRVQFESFTQDFFIAINELTINGKKVSKKQWQELLPELKDSSKEDMDKFIEVSNLKKNFKVNGNWDFDFLATHFETEINNAKRSGNSIVAVLDYYYDADNVKHEHCLCLTGNGNLNVSTYA